MSTSSYARLKLIALPDVVHFPQTDLRLDFADEDREAAAELLSDSGEIGLVLARPTWAQEDGEPVVFGTGTAAQVVEQRSDAESMELVVRGTYRFEIASVAGAGPVCDALVQPIREPFCSDVDPAIIEARDRLLGALASLHTTLGAGAHAEDGLDDERPFEAVVNRIASDLDLSPLRKLALLGESLPERARSVLSILETRTKILERLRPYRHLAQHASTN